MNSTTPDRKFSSLSVDEQRSIRGSCSELLSDGRLSFSSTVDGEAAAAEPAAEGEGELLAFHREASVWIRIAESRSEFSERGL